MKKNEPTEVTWVTSGSPMIPGKCLVTIQKTRMRSSRYICTLDFKRTLDFKQGRFLVPPGFKDKIVAWAKVKPFSGKSSLVALTQEED